MKNNANIYKEKCKTMHKYAIFIDWKTQVLEESYQLSLN